MSQRLILPIDKCAFSAGYKNAAYLKQQGYAHYGVDLYSDVEDTAVKAIGSGKVIAAGMDGVTEDDRLGRCCVIVYQDVELHDGTVCDLACRMFHFDSLSVSAGHLVEKGDVIGQYGNTGSTLVNGQRMGKHLHIEFDTDTEWPQYAVGIKSGGNIIKKGSIDSTADPSSVWYLGEGQTIRGVYEGWYAEKDIGLPELKKDAEEGSAAVPIAWDEDTYESYWGEPVWMVGEKGGSDGTTLKLFDKWWRKIPTMDSPEAGRYARNDEMKAAKIYPESLNVWYDEPTDPKGRAGISDTEETAEREIDALRRAVTEYEIEKVGTINALRDLIAKLEK